MRRELLVALAVFVPVFAVVLLWRPTSHVTFFDLKILNDTPRTVTVHPCWDLDCLDTHGLPESVLPPGGSVQSNGHFPIDTGHEIVVGIRKPGGKPWQFSSCMVTLAAPAQKAGVVRVSHARPCFTAHEP